MRVRDISDGMLVGLDVDGLFDAETVGVTLVVVIVKWTVCPAVRVAWSAVTKYPGTGEGSCITANVGSVATKTPPLVG